MKVLLVSRYPRKAEAPRGGVESVTVVLARALARLPQVRVEVLTVEKDQAHCEVSEVDGVKVHRLSRSGWSQMVDFQIGPARARVAAKLAEIKPDIVHWHESYGLARIPSPSPQVFTIHGFTSENIIAERAYCGWLRSKLWEALEARAFTHYRDVISITPYVKEKIKALTRARIYEIDNPLDERFFEVRHNEEEPPRVLCVGWINPRKNTLTSVRAFVGALKRGCTGTLVVAGTAADPEYYRAVVNEAAAAGCEQQVEFLGQVDHLRLAREQSRASVFLLPSLQENAPMAIAEAMAAKVPVVTSNRCGMPHMVEDGASGFLVDPLDTEQIVERLSRLLRDPELRRRLGSRGREIAEARFHPARVAEKTMQVYREIIGRWSMATPDLR